MSKPTGPPEYDENRYVVEDAAADAAREETKKLTKKQRQEFVSKLKKYKSNLLKNMLSKAEKKNSFGREV